jgi:thioredoxin-dependent peroxiredoxin
MALEKQTLAPDFSTQLHTGENFKLSEVKAKFIILYFYPKDDTSGCTAQACAIRDNISALNKFDAKIYGVSKDTAKKHVKFVEKYELNFPLIVDDKAEICTTYDVLKEKSMYGRKYIGIERTTYVLDSTLKILEVMEKVDPKTHINDLIKILENLS